jgi:cytochrome c oxidase subunit 2
VVVAAVLAAWPTAALASPPRPNWNPGPPYAPLAPHSSEMNSISDLFWIMLIISGIIFIGVTAAVIISFVRFSAKPGAPEPKQVFGNRPIEILWTAIPSFILLIAFIVTVKYMRDINAPRAAERTFDIYAIGHQWWWEFQYPSLGVVTANEVHIPTGITIHYHVKSYDVVHSFWIPQLQRQIDANPGLDNAVFAKFDKPGVYSGACYEYCGEGHAWMKFRAVVETPAQFQAWVKHELGKRTLPTGEAALGERIFLDNTCVSCHAITGTTAGGAVGPNLTHVGSRWTIGAGAAPMRLDAMEHWIYDPTYFKPGVVMPGFPFLSKKDIHAIAVYLLSLK